MDGLTLTTLLIVAAYAIPFAAPGFRWLGGYAVVAGGASVALWVGWVAAQDSSLGAAVAGLFVAMGAAAATFGVVVQGVILWRKWVGWRSFAAALAGAGLGLAGLWSVFAFA